jgi:GMP synthase-like glutamine amidotransferase
MSILNNMKSPRIHCFQHVSFEDPGCIKDWCAAKGYNLSYTHLYKGDKLPAPYDYDWLVVMGGPMGVYDEGTYEWLRDEKIAIKTAIENNKTVLGICLGAQLIASALGARVYPNPEKEIGWFDVMLTGEGKKHQLMKNMSPAQTVFHWHGDTFDLPAGATHLMYSEACRNQAFVYGDKVLALQFHFEVTYESIQAMTDNGRAELPATGKYIQSGKEILSLQDPVGENNRIMYGILDGLEEGSRSSNYRIIIPVN